MQKRPLPLEREWPFELSIEGRNQVNTSNKSNLQSNIPNFSCYIVGEMRDGSPAAAGACPRCNGIHTHCAPIADGETRQAHCGDGYYSRGCHLPEKYTLQLQQGPAPGWLLRAIRLPLGDLEIAAEMVGDGACQCDAQGAPVPAGADVRAAKRALEVCGDYRGAAEIGALLAPSSIRQLMREDQINFWSTPVGRPIRAKIASLLLACWERHGGIDRTPSKYLDWFYGCGVSKPDAISAGISVH